MRKNRILLLILTIVLSLSIAIPLYAFEAYTPALPVDRDVVNTTDETPTFTDPQTNEVWTGVESRLCEHGLWGLDILYANSAGEEIWICHGSLTMDEYVLIECCEKADNGYIAIQPFSTCPRPGCHRSMNAYNNDTIRVRSQQRHCQHRPWGVDILYTWTRTVTVRCPSCGFGTTGSPMPMSLWVCYGFS